MAPYLRFPEREAITERFWGCRPRNPTCGFISWEKGAKIYAWANLIFAATFSILSVLLFLIIFIHLHGASTSSHQEIMKSLKEGSLTQRQNGEWIEKIYSHKSVALMQTLLFFSFLYFSTCWFVGWKLKQAIVDRDLPNLKKYYVIMLIFSIVATILSFWETEEVVSSKSFLVDIPVYIFNIMGLMLTHGFIASLINPDPSQHDDMNRIQFNP